MFMIVPSHHYRRVLTDLKAFAKRPVSVLSGTKGLENESLDRMSQITAEVLGDRLSAFAVLSGPTFALETARGDPTAAVVASSDAGFTNGAARAFPRNISPVPRRGCDGRRLMSSLKT
jgi:glycerol-3-phosphate dehydrogenase (NAD(P)+)